MPEIQGQLVLAQNQHAFIQDNTKGTVQVYAGPHALALSGNDRPVTYDNNKDEFVQVALAQAIKQNPLVAEGHYLILENPATDASGNLRMPKSGANSPADLQTGRKVIIPGPTTFPLWPGQFAQVISDHHLRSNQYLVVRVYNAEEANKPENRPEFLSSTEVLNNGQLLVIKGSDVNGAFRPKTGFEVLKDTELNNGQYVREAQTLERLEYSILLDEDGSKRYERGPKVVFPEATERFVVTDGKRKFKAIELNPQMGLYIKVIADYKEDDGTERKTGEELFITGDVQQIYYPRPEHALIEYDDPTKGFKRQRYYGITIPTGEARYVLNKVKGDIQKEEGPKIFLPDPRSEVIVRRVLDDKTVQLWYPGNQEARSFNETLRSLAETSTSYLADNVVLSAAADVAMNRGINRGTSGNQRLSAASLASGSFEGDKLQRGTKFTPPPMLTLSTKYDGVPAINVYTGYAVQVVDKSGNRRIEIGPTTILLNYDESLEVLELSTGKPKTTDTLYRDVYLRVDNNLVSDMVRVETKDFVAVEVNVSYRVNFIRDQKDKWFSVENYVKFLCDHLRSLLKAKAKGFTVKEFYEKSADIIRDVVLGAKVDATTPRSRVFSENGMEVYDVEVLSVYISDEKIAPLLKLTYQKAVESDITLAAAEQGLKNTRRDVEIQEELVNLQTQLSLKQQELTQEINEAKAETALAAVQSDIALSVVRMDADVAAQEQKNAVAAAEFARRKMGDDYTMSLDEKRVEHSEKIMAAIQPDLVAALQASGDKRTVTELATSIAPLAVNEQLGLGTVLDRVFKGTPVETVLGNIQSRSAKSGK